MGEIHLNGCNLNIRSSPWSKLALSMPGLKPAPKVLCLQRRVGGEGGWFRCGWVFSGRCGMATLQHWGLHRDPVPGEDPPDPAPTQCCYLLMAGGF